MLLFSMEATKCQIRLKQIAIWLLLMAAMLHTGWSKMTDWMQCNQYLPGCNCNSFNGRKQAECINVGLTSIPDIFNEEIQVLRFDNNNIRVLKREAFLSAGLVNLHKVIMPNCSITDVDKAAFANMALLITIDLSSNEIKQLDPMTFRSTERLRQVNLNNNLIQRLDDRLFWNLSNLQKVELNDNRITHISNHAFFQLQTLSVVTLKNNQLKTVPATIFNHLNKLNYLELQNNPWRCDCQLREFFEYAGNVTVSQPTYCAKPEYMRNQSWATLKPEQFTCKPDIVWPHSGLAIIKATGPELTLSCKVVGNPKLETHWTFSQRLSNETVTGLSTNDHKYTTHVSGDTTVWNNVTISKLSSQDEGVYTCVARNAAGQVKRKVHVTVPTAVGRSGVPQRSASHV